MPKPYLNEKSVEDFDVSQVTWIESLPISDQYNFLRFKILMLRWRVDRFIMHHRELYTIDYEVDYVPGIRLYFNAGIGYEITND